MYGTIPSFDLLERNGDKISQKDFENKVWITSFIFTSCGGQCPIITSKMKSIQSKLRFKENLRLVSITVDPKRDDVKALRDYALKYDADPYKWLFLTGPDKDIQSLVRNGFHYIDGPGKADELYNVIVDPLERRDLIADAAYADTVRAMRQTLAAWPLPDRRGH